MGMFDFANDDIVESVRQAITDAGADISDLKVSLDGNTVTLSGSAADSAAASAAVNAAKGVSGVDSVVNNLSVNSSGSSSASSASASGKVHTVVYGDTLWGISEKYYGNGARYMEIFNANKEQWKNYNYDPNVLYPGWELTIP